MNPIATFAIACSLISMACANGLYGVQPLSRLSLGDSLSLNQNTQGVQIGQVSGLGNQLVQQQVVGAQQQLNDYDQINTLGLNSGLNLLPQQQLIQTNLGQQLIQTSPLQQQQLVSLDGSLGQQVILGGGRKLYGLRRDRPVLVDSRVGVQDILTTRVDNIVQQVPRTVLVNKPGYGIVQAIGSKLVSTPVVSVVRQQRPVIQKTITAEAPARIQSIVTDDKKKK